MNRSYKELVKNTGLLTISSFSSKILVFLLVPLYTSVLSTEAYGFYDLTHTTMTLVFPLITADFISAIMRFCMDKETNQAEVINIGLRIWTVTTTIICAILLANIPLKLVPYISGYEVLIALMYATYSLHQFLIQSTKGLEKVKTLAIGGVIGTLVVVFSNLLFLLLFKWDLRGFYIATILGEAIPSLYMAAAIHGKQYIRISRNKLLEKRMISYSLPLVVNTTGWWINNNIDKYIITWLVGLSTNGLLSVAYKVPNILTVIGGIFLQAWQISAVKEFDTEESVKFYNNVYKYYNLALVIVTSGLILFTKVIAKIMFQKAFFDAWIFVPFLLISCFFTQIASYYGPILSAQMNSKAMAVSSICGIVVNITLNIGLTLLIGPVGIAVATAVSSFVIYIMRRFFVSKSLRITEGPRVYISWFLLCLSALMVTLDTHIIITIILFGIISMLNIRTIADIVEKGKSLIYKVQRK